MWGASHLTGYLPRESGIVMSNRKPTMEEILISEYNSAELLLEKSKRAGLTGNNLEIMQNYLLEIGEKVFTFSFDSGDTYARYKEIKEFLYVYKGKLIGYLKNKEKKRG